MKPVRIATAVVLLAALSDVTVWAQGSGDAAKGEALVNRMCAACHMPRAGMPALPGGASVPKFQDLAQRGVTAEHINQTLTATAHPKRPVPLTSEQVADIAAYIQSLKQ